MSNAAVSEGLAPQTNAGLLRPIGIARLSQVRAAGSTDPAPPVSSHLLRNVYAAPKKFLDKGAGRHLGLHTPRSARRPPVGW